MNLIVCFSFSNNTLDLRIKKVLILNPVLQLYKTYQSMHIYFTFCRKITSYFIQKAIFYINLRFIINHDLFANLIIIQFMSEIDK